MTRNNFIAFAIMLISIAACTKTSDILTHNPETVINDVIIKVTHESDFHTKTILKNDGAVWWKPKDAIGVFFGNNCLTFYSYNMKDAPSANFIGNVLIVQGHNENSDYLDDYSYFGVFPPNLYNEYTTCIKSFDYRLGNGDYHIPERDGESLNVYLPSRQQGVAGTFDSNNFISIAKNSTYNELSFYNLCGGLAFCVERDDIYAVTFEGNSNEVLAGSVNIEVNSNNFPYVKEVNNGKTLVEIAMKHGEHFVPGEWYYIVMLPTSMYEGYTMTFYSDNEIGTLTSSAPVEIRRSVFGRLNAPDTNAEFESYPITEYIEGGVSYGYGVEIDGTVWAPVNCGYEPANDRNKGYTYGKLYQWGRKYGLGYCGVEIPSPSFEHGPVAIEIGQAKENENVFYINEKSPYDWLYPSKDNLWNFGTEENPIKTEDDPCPSGWRVPTIEELSNLMNKIAYSSFTTNEIGQYGCYITGNCAYTGESSQIFVPAAGRGKDWGSEFRNEYGFYWSSSTWGNHVDSIEFSNHSTSVCGCYRTDAFSVRCVRE